MITENTTDRFGTPAFYAAIGRAFIVMCAITPVLFFITLIDELTGHQLNADAGIHPHDLTRLDGIALAPFLHNSFGHVTANSVPLIMLGTFMLVGGVKRFLIATAIIMVTSGLAIWLIGDPNTYVVGASGVCFGYLGTLLTRGIVERSRWNIAAGLLIGMLYGWLIIGVLPGDPMISWQGHLFGFVGGVLAAVVLRRRPAAVPAGDGRLLGTVPAFPDLLDT
jgi:membrane associated rhomboid family serine protease